MRHPPNEWPSSASGEGILFFAQLMREMTTPRTFESFRVFSLDTVARLVETRSVLIDVERKRIPAASAEPFCEELLWSLSVDPVVSELEPELVGLLSARLGEKQHKAERIARLRPEIELLHKRVAPKYRVALQRRIVKLHDKSDRRNDLRVTTGFYSSHLINVGYSKTYIKDVVEDRFFSKSMAHVNSGALESFFAAMDCEDKVFTTYTLINKSFSRALKEVSENIQDFEDLPKRVQAACENRTPEKGAKWLIMKISARDEYGAVNTCERTILSIQAMNYLGPQHQNYSWDQRRAVTRGRALATKLVSPTSLSLGRAQASLRPVGRSGLAATIRDVMSELDPPSSARLLNSLTTSALHKDAAPADSHLLSLWSAIEVLLSDPPEGIPRIVHYADKIIPCIGLRYMRRSIAAVYDEMQLAYRQPFVRIVLKEPDFSSHANHTRFGAIMMIEANKPIRDELLNLCSGNPLARHRLYRLWKDCRSPRAFEGAISNHDHRLRWQVYRIYRARNQLVHAGITPSYLESITENLFDYYKSAVWTILNQAKREKGTSSLRVIVDEIGVEYAAYKAYLRSVIDAASFDKTSALRCLRVQK